MAGWRKEPVFSRIDKPTRIDAARRVGYKAKQGVVVVRTRVRRGGLRKGKIHMKRKPSKAGIKKITMGKSIQRIAEERTARRYPNLEVLKSASAQPALFANLQETTLAIDDGGISFIPDPAIGY